MLEVAGTLFWLGLLSSTAKQVGFPGRIAGSTDSMVLRRPSELARIIGN
jgi:hypothetical protein